MNWADQPATWKQMRQLKRSGYASDHKLTKSEASLLITRLGGVDPDPPSQEAAAPATPVVQHPQAFHAAEQTGKMPVDVHERQQFWLDTCRGTTSLCPARSLVLELYRKHGCLFSEPTHQQVQD